MPKHDFVVGTPLVVTEATDDYELKNILRLERGQIYPVERVQIFPEYTLLPQSYIDAGHIPEAYKPHMTKGIRTTNHDSIGSDRFVTIRGRTFTAAYFRRATAEEVNAQAEAVL